MSEELEATDESWELACKIVLGNLGPNTAARKIDEALTAAKIEGARLGIEAAAAQNRKDGFYADHILALDPAQIAGGSDAD